MSPNKSELYAAIVWLFAGLSLVVYGIMSFFNASVPGVEDLIKFLSSVEGKYIYLAAFISIFIEGLYFFGNFFPGSTLVVILTIFSQLAGPTVFIITILSIFVGWCLAGVVNIFFAKIYHVKLARLPEDIEYQVKDRFWATWFPAFRANYEVAQIAEGGNPYKVLISSVRVKVLASIAAALLMLVVPFFVDINEVGNEEGFLVLTMVAVISFVVGGRKMKKYLKREE